MSKRYTVELNKKKRICKCESQITERCSPKRHKEIFKMISFKTFIQLSAQHGKNLMYK